MRTYVLDPGAKTPLYEQLYEAIKAEILSGAIAGGEKLPSKRALAEHLGISPITVENAYNQLLTEGYLSSRPRSGFYAEWLEALPQPRQLPAPAPILTPPPTVSASQFPFSTWAKLMRGVLLDQHDLLLQPPPNTGLPVLRQAIAGMLRRSRGMEADPNCILLGAGAEYLYNILIQLLGRDRIYGLENPGHRKARQVYEAGGVTVRPLRLDENGIDLQSLRQSGANILHLSPSHQFPTGIVTPIARRQQLMAWLAESRDRFLIEDDYDAEFRFDRKPIPTMFSMDSSGHVIYMNTFSKTITPALRISYMILPQWLMAQYLDRLGFYSCTVPTFEQLTLARFLDEGYFERHVNRMKRRYRLLRDRFLALLHQSPLGERIAVQGDEAGLHFLLRLDTKLSDEALEQRLQQAEIPAVPLSRYEFTPRACGWLVLAYSDLDIEDLERVVGVLEGLVRP